MKLRDLITELEDIAKRAGDWAEVTVTCSEFNDDGAVIGTVSEDVVGAEYVRGGVELRT